MNELFTSRQLSMEEITHSQLLCDVYIYVWLWSVDFIWGARGKDRCFWNVVLSPNGQNKLERQNYKQWSASKVRHRKKSVKISKAEAAQILRPHQKTERLLDPCSWGKTRRKKTKRKATHNLDEQHRKVDGEDQAQLHSDGCGSWPVECHSKSTSWEEMTLRGIPGTLCTKIHLKWVSRFFQHAV